MIIGNNFLVRFFNFLNIYFSVSFQLIIVVPIRQLQSNNGIQFFPNRFLIEINSEVSSRARERIPEKDSTEECC